MWYLSYLDLGAGSILLQTILAGVLGAAFTIRMYWGRLMSALRRKTAEDKSKSGEFPAEEKN
jgi:hypothetical protein